MTFYHRTQAIAKEAGEPYAKHFHIKTELEPNNGWVLVLVPINMEVFDYPLGPLLEVAEIDIERYKGRLRTRSEGYKRPPNVEDAVPYTPRVRTRTPVAPPPPPPPPPPGGGLAPVKPPPPPPPVKPT